MVTELIQAQATDVFRIGLIVALVVTMFRTRAATGTVLPLAAGVLFVAVIVPMTQGGTVAAPIWLQIATGIGVNLVFVAVALAVAGVLRSALGAGRG